MCRGEVVDSAGAAREVRENKKAGDFVLYMAEPVTTRPRIVAHEEKADENSLKKRAVRPIWQTAPYRSMSPRPVRTQGENYFNGRSPPYFECICPTLALSISSSHSSAPSRSFEMCCRNETTG